MVLNQPRGLGSKHGRQCSHQNFILFVTSREALAHNFGVTEARGILTYNRVQWCTIKSPPTWRRRIGCISCCMGAILTKLTSKEAQDILNKEMPGYRVISPSSRDGDENDAKRPVRAEAVAPDVSPYRQKFGAKQQADPTPKNPNPTVSSDSTAPSSTSAVVIDPKRPPGKRIIGYKS